LAGLPVIAYSEATCVGAAACGQNRSRDSKTGHGFVTTPFDKGDFRTSLRSFDEILKFLF
jgi:hypothetical protein